MVASRKSQSSRSSPVRDRLSDKNKVSDGSLKPIPTSRAYNDDDSRGMNGDSDFLNNKGRNIWNNHEVALSPQSSNNDLAVDVSHSYINNNNDRSADHSSFPQFADPASSHFSGPSHPLARPELNPLVRQTTTASIALLFGLLIWRSLTSFELASQFTDDSMRLLSLIPSVALLVANIAGFLLNIVKPYNFKNHLKVILAINIIREWVELVYSLFMMVTWSPTSSVVPRETYFGSMFMNIWWCVVCFSFSRSRWVLKHTLSNSEYQYLQQKQVYEQHLRGY